MKEITFARLIALGRARKFTRAVIVMSPRSWREPCIPSTVEGRSYVVSVDNDLFNPDGWGIALYGSALDGGDPDVPLHDVVANFGYDRDWLISYCYILDDDHPANHAYFV